MKIFHFKYDDIREYEEFNMDGVLRYFLQDNSKKSNMENLLEYYLN